MARRVEIRDAPGLAEYESIAHLAPAVAELRREAALLTPRLEGRTVWMVNSTEQGGGVAEMLPTMIPLLRELGVATEWVVLESDRPEFFALTKRIHNLIHGAGDPELTSADREVYAAVCRENAEQMARWVRPGDLLAVHDPQPMPLAAFLNETVAMPSVWRCHIGLDEETPATRAAWSFLQPYAAAYRQAVFSAPEYIPPYLGSRSRLIHPAINPLTHKNRELGVHKLVGILSNAALVADVGPVLTPEYPATAQRLGPDGAWGPANTNGEFGLLTRPILTQVSRWDALKGFAPLMDAFVRLKRLREGGSVDSSPVHARRLELVRLVLAGPDPESVADDPEALEVLDDLTRRYIALDERDQRDIALITLPMSDPRQNALMVNALQRASSIVVQNSLREGFGLTITEAMWKRLPVLTNRRACGPRQQIRDRMDGRLADDPEDTEALAAIMDEMLADGAGRARWGRTAQRRAHDDFMIFTQVRRWLEVLTEIAA